MGLFDVRARLGQSQKGFSWWVICDPDAVHHLCRVVIWAGGTIDDQKETSEGVILKICK